MGAIMRVVRDRLIARLETNLGIHSRLGKYEFGLRQRLPNLMLKGVLQASDIADEILV